MRTTVQRDIAFENASPTAPEAPQRFAAFMDAAQHIPGWFQDQAAATWDSLLAYQTAKGIEGHMAEIGVYRGKSALMLAMHSRPEEELVLVDIDSMDEPKRFISPVKANNVHYIQSESFDLIRSGLVESGGNKFRFISIDGEHTREAVARDLGFANQLLSRDGIISLDDFFSTSYPHITAAVFEFIAQHPAELMLFLCGFNKAYLCRPRAGQYYLQFIKDQMGYDMDARQQDATFFKTTESTDYNCFGMGLSFGNPRYHGPEWCVESIDV